MWTTVSKMIQPIHPRLIIIDISHHLIIFPPEIASIYPNLLANSLYPFFMIFHLQYTINLI